MTGCTYEEGVCDSQISRIFVYTAQEESASLYRSEAEWGREKGGDDASSARHTDVDSALEEVEEEGELREEKWDEEWVVDAGHADGASSDEEDGDESTALSSEPTRKVCA